MVDMAVTFSQVLRRSFDTVNWRQLSGWTFLIAGILCARSFPAYLLLNLVLLAGGLVLLAGGRAPFGKSPSARLLAQVERQAGARCGAELHRPSKARSAAAVTWRYMLAGALSLCAGVALAWIVLASGSGPGLSAAFLAVLCAGLVATKYGSHGLQLFAATAAFLLLALFDQPTTAAAVASLLVIAVIGYSWREREWRFLILASLGGYLVAATSALDSPIDPTLIATVILGVSLPFAASRRRLRDTALAQGALLLAYALGALLLLGSDPAFVVAPIFAALFFAAFAWKEQGRFSYAKYFFLVGILLFAAVLISVLTPGWFVLSLIVIAVSLLAAGASLGSQSLRVAGLAALAGAVTAYVTEVLPFSLSYGMLLNRLGLGLLIAVCLPVLADWYATLPLERGERRMVPLILLAGYLIAGLVAFAAILLSMDGIFQSALWLILGLSMGWLALLRRLHLVMVAAKAMFAAAWAKFALVDVISLSSADRVAAWVIALGALGAYWWEFRRLARRYRP
jgi:hypothetical protein